MTFDLVVLGHGLWMYQYGDKRPVFDVLSPEGAELSPVLSAVYLFLTMIIVFQVRPLYSIQFALTPSRPMGFNWHGKHTLSVQHIKNKSNQCLFVTCAEYTVKC